MGQGSSSQRIQGDYTFAASKDLGRAGWPAIGSSSEAWHIMTLKPALSRRSFAQKRNGNGLCMVWTAVQASIYAHCVRRSAYVFTEIQIHLAHSHVLPLPSVHYLRG